MSVPHDEVARIDRAVAHLRGMTAAHPDFKPRVGIVLGSGLGGLAEQTKVLARAPYSTIPGFSPSTVEGHAGQLILGHFASVPVAVMAGRIHLYEGHSPSDVVFPVRVLVRSGLDLLVITNAAGGLTAKVPGELMLISDHLNLSGHNPLAGVNDPRLGVRFPDMTEAYDKQARAVALEVARAEGVPLREGVYAGLLGPTYETPAEVRMLRHLGADAVGMSTVLEVIAARHMGGRVLGFSCITNLAAGMTGQPLSHDEVKTTAEAVQGQLFGLIGGVIAKMFGTGP